MSHYQLAKKLALLDANDTDAAELVDRSRSFVVTLRKTWRASAETLRVAWEHNLIAYDVVKRIAKQDPGHQSALVLKYLNITEGRARAAKREALDMLEIEEEKIKNDGS